MDKNSLYSLMQANGIPTGELLCHYAFSGASGSLVFNEAYEVSGDNWMSGHFLDWPSTGKIDADKFPGISRLSSDLGSSSSDFDGSGYLTGDSVITIGTGVPTGSWTAFISFSGEAVDDRKDLSRVILSTNNSPNSTSGFFVGRNSRSLFVENYNNDQSVQDIYTHKKELLGKNIVSITKNDLNDISVSVHDFLNTHELSTETFSLNGYSESDQINIGGFLNNQNEVLGYTGFSGYLDQFVLVSGSLAGEQRKDIVDSFYAKTYSEAGYVVEETAFTAESGLSLETGVIDSGVTGYENAHISNLSVPGGNLSLYVNSGVTGEITGSFYSGVPGTGTETVLATVFKEESYSYSEDDIKSYSPSIVSFNKALSANDVYEIYTQSNKSDSLNLTAEYDKVEKNFTLGEIFTGIEKNNQAAMIYANGYLLESGDSNTGMYTRVDDYSINASGYSGVDTVMYDLLPSYANGHVLYETSSATGISFATSPYLKKDIYFEGVKLLSGEHWTASAGYVEISDSDYPIEGNVGIGAGTVSFVPVADQFSRVTGKGANVVETSLKLMNEQVWINGIKQIKNKDYFTVSNKSQLNSAFRQNPLETILYSGQSGFYNV